MVVPSVQGLTWLDPLPVKHHLTEPLQASKVGATCYTRCKNESSEGQQVKYLAVVSKSGARIWSRCVAPEPDVLTSGSCCPLPCVAPSLTSTICSCEPPGHPGRQTGHILLVPI